MTPQVAASKFQNIGVLDGAQIKYDKKKDIAIKNERAPLYQPKGQPKLNKVTLETLQKEEENITLRPKTNLRKRAQVKSKFIEER